MSTPVTVIGGYLGAGKTTLINAVLRQADGLRIAVLVNEFGALSIDEDLVVSQDGDVISIAGGCICCAFGDNLIGAVAELLALPTPPEHLVIEASGVAIPAAIAATLSLMAGVSLAGIVVLADADTVQTRARDKYIGDTILRQIEGADLIVVTKPDLVDSAQIEAIEVWLRGQNPHAAIVAATQGACPNALVLGDMLTAGRPLPQTLEDHGSLYTSKVFEQVGLASGAALAELFETQNLGVLRAKGFLRDGSGKLRALQVVGSRAIISPAQENANPGLVCIGLKDQFEATALRAALAELGFEATDGT